MTIAIIQFLNLKNRRSTNENFTAQTSTNEAQTNETILGEFGACGGLSDLRMTTNIISKKPSSQTKFYSTNQHKRKHKRLRLFWVIWSMWGAGDVIV